MIAEQEKDRNCKFKRIICAVDESIGRTVRFASFFTSKHLDNALLLKLLPACSSQKNISCSKVNSCAREFTSCRTFEKLRFVGF